MTKRKIISPEKRQSILTEALKPGNSLSEVAKKHNVLPKTLGSWKRKYLVEQDKNNQFIELKVNNTNPEILLNKASLEFKDFSLSIDGQVKSTSLIEIINILGKSCSQ